MTNATLEKFGYPASLVHDYDHWCVLLRPAQATFAALVLGAKSSVTQFSDLPAPAFAELHQVTHDIETVLRVFRPYDRINYLMLMMVDPHVHFHVLPRYQARQNYLGTDFPDTGWPGPPALANAVTPDDELRQHILQDLKQLWPGAR